MFLAKEEYLIDENYIRNLKIFKLSSDEFKNDLLTLTKINNKVIVGRVKVFLKSFDNFKTMSKSEVEVENVGKFETLTFASEKSKKSKFIDGSYDVGGVSLYFCTITKNQEGDVSLFRENIVGVCNDKAYPVRSDREELIIEKAKGSVKFLNNGIVSSSKFNMENGDDDEQER